MKKIKKSSRTYRQCTLTIIDKKSTAGVTLVALIITMIILLILAGISIASFTGDKGLFNETKGIKNNIEGIQNQTIDSLQSIANDLSTSAGDALNP